MHHCLRLRKHCQQNRERIGYIPGFYQTQTSNVCHLHESLSLIFKFDILQKLFIIQQRVWPEEELQQQLGYQSEHWGRQATPLKTILVQLC